MEPLACIGGDGNVPADAPRRELASTGPPVCTGGDGTGAIDGRLEFAKLQWGRRFAPAETPLDRSIRYPSEYPVGVYDKSEPTGSSDRRPAPALLGNTKCVASR